MSCYNPARPALRDCVDALEEAVKELDRLTSYGQKFAAAETVKLIEPVINRAKELL